MDSCLTGDHTAGYHTNTHITTCNTEEPPQKYRLGTVSKRLRGGGGGVGGLKYRGLILRNHHRSTALEQSEKEYRGRGLKYYSVHFFTIYSFTIYLLKWQHVTVSLESI